MSEGWIDFVCRTSIIGEGARRVVNVHGTKNCYFLEMNGMCHTIRVCGVCCSGWETLLFLGSGLGARRLALKVLLSVTNITFQFTNTIVVTRLTLYNCLACANEN